MYYGFGVFICSNQPTSYVDSNQRVYAMEIIQYGSGKGDDGWWNANKMVQQTQKAIRIFNQAFPNDIAVFAFDNSSGHACKAPNALVTQRMNLGPGGKQPVIRDTEFYSADSRLLHLRNITGRYVPLERYVLRRKIRTGS